MIPVIDLRGGVVVRAVAGRRAEYQPLVSPLCPTSDPLDVAQRLIAASGSERLYIADLDAILQQRTSLHAELFRVLQQEGLRLSVDAGLRQPSDLHQRHIGEVAEWIVGLETWEHPETLTTLVQQYGPTRLRFSLDLQAGRLLAGPAWKATTPLEVVALVIAAGFTRLLVLDLSDVGVNAGNRQTELLSMIRREFPQLDLWAGGGVRGPDDLAALADVGVDGVLVASALHDGRIVNFAS